MKDHEKQLGDDGLMSISEAAEFLSMSRGTIYILMNRDELPSVRIGRSRRIPRSAVRRLVNDALAGSAK